MNYNNYGNIHEFLNSNEAFAINGPAPYFPETSERCVEIPYIFCKIKNEKKMLDIGTSLSDPIYFYGLLLLKDRGVDIHTLDIVPIEKVMNRFKKFDQNLLSQIKFMVGDIRRWPHISNHYDMILCVSALEHVGFDVYIDSEDTVFDRPLEDYTTFPDFYSWSEDHLAVNQMLRLLRPNGRLLLTIPFGSGGVLSSKDSKGRYASHLEYNLKKWRNLKAAIEYPVEIEERCFKMFSTIGWREVSLDTSFDESRSSEKHLDKGVLCTEIKKA